MQHPSLQVITGPMCSGKTEEMIRRLKRYEIAGHPILAFKPKKDTRSEECVISRNGKQYQAVTIQNPEEIFSHINESSVIAIDEAHFFPSNLGETALKLVRQKHHVIIAGLDMDFQGNPFETVALSLALADTVTKLTAVCMKCRQGTATRSHRLVASLERELVGDKEYEPRCFHCFESPTLS